MVQMGLPAEDHQACIDHNFLGAGVNPSEHGTPIPVCLRCQQALLDYEVVIAPANLSWFLESEQSEQLWRKSIWALRGEKVQRSVPTEKEHDESFQGGKGLYNVWFVKDYFPQAPWIRGAASSVAARALNAGKGMPPNGYVSCGLKGPPAARLLHAFRGIDNWRNRMVGRLGVAPLVLSGWDILHELRCLWGSEPWDDEEESTPEERRQTWNGPTPEEFEAQFYRFPWARRALHSRKGREAGEMTEDDGEVGLVV